MNEAKTVRCAIYTRKSVEAGLELKYTSIDAQRDLCEQFVRSRASLGWTALPARYDDGGFSGKDLNRPAMRRLLDDCRAGRIDKIVVYRFDRLARSVLAFAKLNEDLERWGVSFCSISEQFETSTPMGRMMLTFAIAAAQWERESIAGRIKDKIVQSRKMGVWTGGPTPYGYRLENKALVRDGETAPVVEWIFRRYAAVYSALQIVAELESEGRLRKDGTPWRSYHVYKILRNPVYAGKVTLGAERYEGRHEALVDADLFDRVQRLLDLNGPKNLKGKRPAPDSPPLAGLLRCGHCGGAMTPSHCTHGGKRYSYYVCSRDSKRGVRRCPVGSVPASDIESLVFREVGRVLSTGAFRRAMRAALGEGAGPVCDALSDFEPFWDSLFPIERTRILQLLVKDVVLGDDGVDIRLDCAGISNLAGELAS